MTPDPGKRPGDDPEVTARREAWTDQVCQLLELDRATVAEVTPDLLRLVGLVAHGAARPAGPITALLVGLAAAREGATDAQGLRTAMARVEALLEDWQ